MHMHILCIHYKWTKILEKLVLMVVFTLNVTRCGIRFILSTVILSFILHCCSAKQERCLLALVSCGHKGMKSKLFTVYLENFADKHFFKFQGITTF